MLYLNTGKDRFVNVAGAANMDDPSDSRALGLTDWDQDGDMDLWFANRTGPRIRLQRNDLPTNERFISVHLRGSTTNRDAIGARVTVMVGGRSLVKTLRAGEGYLAQSSKTIHFGLPNTEAIKAVSVRWPGSAEEIFSGVVAGNRYLLKQGTGEAAALPVRRTITMQAQTIPDVSTSSIRLIPHAPLRLPRLSYQTAQGSQEDLAKVSRPTLAVLWAPWCQPCLQEIAILSQNAALGKAVDVVLINIDSKAPAARASPSFKQGHSNQQFIESMDIVQRCLPGLAKDLALPCTVLLNADSCLVALYRGSAAPTQIIADLSLTKISEVAFRDHAVPFPGRWLMQSMPADLIDIPSKLLEIGETESAFDYLERHITGDSVPQTKADLPSIGLSMAMVAGAYSDLATKLKDPSKISKAFVRAVQYLPNDLRARADLAIHYDAIQQKANAASQYRQVLKIKPDHLAAMNSLAWILASAADAKLRNPEEAVALAEYVCQATEFQSPEPIDTVAAAYAAAGRFNEAIKASIQAIQLADTNGQTGVARQLRKRLSLYQQGKPYVE